MKEIKRVPVFCNTVYYSAPHFTVQKMTEIL